MLNPLIFIISFNYLFCVQGFTFFYSYQLWFAYSIIIIYFYLFLYLIHLLSVLNSNFTVLHSAYRIYLLLCQVIVGSI